MGPTPTISLEQWRALVAVVDEGGYAAAAEAIHKSQSAVTYAVQRVEKLLGVKAFRLEGRKAALTPAGRMLYSRARVLLDEASSLERAAHRNSAGWEAEITIAVEIIFPTWLLLKCLDRFGQEAPHTRIEVIETVLGGAPEALLERRVDLALTPRVPPGFSGESLMRRLRAGRSSGSSALPARPAPHAQGSSQAPEPDRPRHERQARQGRRLSRGRAALDRRPHGDVAPGRAHGLRLRLVPGGEDPRGDRGRRAEGVTARGRRRRFRRDLPRPRRSRRGGAWGETPCGDSQAGCAERMCKETSRRHGDDEGVDPGR